jgi:hypothetical protein
MKEGVQVTARNAGLGGPDGRIGRECAPGGAPTVVRGWRGFKPKPAQPRAVSETNVATGSNGLHDKAIIQNSNDV